MRLRSLYEYIYFITNDITGHRIMLLSGWIYIYAGIKHEYDVGMMENAIYKFIEYFEDIFGGVYVYFFVSHEEPIIDSFDFCLWN